MQQVEIRRLKAADADIEVTVRQLNDPAWQDFDNQFSVASLKAFLADEHRVYLVAYIDQKLAGAAHGYLLQHPAGIKYFYVDEVDTLKTYRRRGVATALMAELRRIAQALGASELWLGADEGNDAAHALYRKLEPSEIEPGKIYTYKVKHGR